MQSLVVQASQVAGRRTFTSSGETRLPTKLNWPMGHTYLQKAAPRNTASMAKEVRKKAAMIHAVSHGLAHRSNTS